MAGPRPHGERVDGAPIVGGAAGRPGGEQKRKEVSLCSWLANSLPLSPGHGGEDAAQRHGLCPTSPGLHQPRPPPPVQALVATEHYLIPFTQKPWLLARLWISCVVGKSAPGTTQISLHPTLGLKPWTPGQGSRGGRGKRGREKRGSRR